VAEVQDQRRPAAPSDRLEGERGLVVGILRTGLALSMALLAVGLALAATHGRLRADPVGPGEALASLVAGRPSGFMAVGILVLVATPVVRVLALVASFAREGDRRFAAVAAAVALVLAIAVGIGRA
jgi:uncharacterized membrane protein